MSMTRIISLLITALAFCGSAKAQIDFFSPIFDFGTIHETDGEVSHSFTGVNRGEKPIIILDIFSSCGCTVPDFSRKPILPGEKTEIKVVFNPKNQSGIFQKELTVFSVERKKVGKLTVRGTVIPRPLSIEEQYPAAAGEGLRLSETMKAFTYIYPGYRKQSAIACHNDSDSPIQIRLEPLKSSSRLDIDYPTTLGPHQSGTINLAYFIPKDETHYGTLSDVFTVHVNGKSNKTTILAHAIGIDDPRKSDINRAPKLEFSESILKFGAVKWNIPQKKHKFTINNIGKGDLIIRAAESKDVFGITLPPYRVIKPGESMEVEVTLCPGQYPAGPLTDNLMIISNDPTRPMRRLRITAIIEK